MKLSFALLLATATILVAWSIHGRQKARAGDVRSSVGEQRFGEPFPPRQPADLAYFNDSGIGGEESYATYELKKFRQQTGYDPCLILRPHLPDGTTIETYAAELFGRWKIGERAGGKGVLVLYIEDIAELKIEVGYALEPIYPDLFCSSFQDSVRTYMSGDYVGDVIQIITSSMIAQAKGEPFEDLIPNLGKRAGGMARGHLSGGAGITTRDFYKDMEERLVEAKNWDGKEIAEAYPAGSTAAEAAHTFLRSWVDGIDYPFLPVITANSHLMRLEYPHPAGRLRGFWEAHEKGKPMKVLEQGDFAVARFASGNAWPLFLRRGEDTLWRVDFPRTWAHVESSSSSWWFVHERQPWIFAFPDNTSSNGSYVPPDLPPVDQDPLERIRELEQRVVDSPEDADAYFALGSHLYFECYWLRAAIDVLEAGLLLDPTDIRHRFMVLDCRAKFPMWDGVPEHYEKIIELAPDNRSAWRRYVHHVKYHLSDEKLLKQLKRRSPHH